MSSIRSAKSLWLSKRATSVGSMRGWVSSATKAQVATKAQAARRISSFADLEGLEFLARIDLGTDANGEAKNEIRMAVTPDHRDYAAAMGQHAMAAARYAPQAAPAPVAQGAFPTAAAASHAAPPANGADPRPTWAR